MEQTYTKLKFELVGSESQSRVFFLASGTPGNLGTMTSANGSW